MLAKTIIVIPMDLIRSVSRVRLSKMTLFRFTAKIRMMITSKMWASSFPFSMIMGIIGFI